MPTDSVTTSNNAETRINFRIVEASSSEDGFDAQTLEIAHPQSQGWHSAKFTDYPVSLLLELERSAELRQLQILSHESKIASRIELFVGEHQNELNRLGFMSLEANERSQFQARELKSVFIRAKAKFIQLILHRNHHNSINLCSQVGLVAINVLATRIDPAGPSDLAVDMSLDPHTVKQLRELHALKIRSVELENYDEAKRLKIAIEKLRSTGAELARLEAKKRSAVQLEDYDTAKHIKNQMDALRGQVFEPTVFPVQSDQHHNAYQPHTHIHTHHQQQSPHTIQHNSHHQQQQQQDDDLSPTHHESLVGHEAFETPGYCANLSHLSPAQSLSFSDADEPKAYDDRPLPAKKHGEESSNPFGHRKGSVPLTTTEDLSGGIKGPENQSLPRVPELSEGDRAASFQLIETFGESTVAQLLSRKVWQHRINALQTIRHKVLTEYLQSTTRPSSSTLFVLSISALGPFIKDQIAQVSQTALLALQALFDRIMPRIDVIELHAAIEPIIPLLITRVETVSGRSKAVAHACLVAIISVQPSLVCKFVLRPLKNLNAPKPMQARIDILKEIVIRSSRDDTHQRLVAIVRTSLLPALKHRSGTVRECATTLAIEIYKQVHNDLVPLLEGLNPKLMSSLKTLFNKSGIQQKPPAERFSGSNERDRVHHDAAAVAANHSVHSTDHTTATMSGVGEDIHVQAGEEYINDEEEFDDTICRFCGVQDDAFTQEENLDLHYWRVCPMLASCKLCEQVVEIPLLSDHLLKECDRASQVVTCNRCNEQFIDHEFKEHNRQQLCTPQQDISRANRCPLCHHDIQAGENGWRIHLLQAPGCPQNTR